MAKLGLVDDSQFEKELNDCLKVKKDTNIVESKKDTVKKDTVKKDIVNPVIEGTIEDTPKKGRPIGGVEVPESVRKLIAEEAVINGRQSALELAKGFGISESSVSAYTKGATSTATYDKKDEKLADYLHARKTRRAKQALQVLGNSLSELTPQKLNGAKARDLAGIAKDMAQVVKHMEPENTGSNDANAPKFIVYAPQLRQENSFEVIVSPNE